MFSRALTLSGQHSKYISVFTTCATAADPCSKTKPNPCTPKTPDKILKDSKCGDGKSGDGVTSFTRRVRAIEPGKVRMGFIPEEWFQFFYNKTGVTGPYVFGIGLTTYLFSKEIYVCEHEYYTGISILIMAIYVVKKFGSNVANYADKEIEKYENGWKEERIKEVSLFKKAVQYEEQSQWQADGNLLLMQAKRENVLFQLEDAYRRRLMEVYVEVKRRLDYQLESHRVKERIFHKNMVNWVIKQVLAALGPDYDKKNFENCITMLSQLADQVKKEK